MNTSSAESTKLEIINQQNILSGGLTVLFSWKAIKGWPVEYVSPNVLVQFGYTAEDFINGKYNYAELIHPDDVNKVIEEVNYYSESGAQYFEQEYRLKVATGEYKWIYDFTNIIRDQFNRITQYLGYVQDISSRKTTELKLKESEERYKKIIGSVTDYVYTVYVENKKAVSTIHNESCIAVTGYLPEEFQNNPNLWIQMVPEEEHYIVKEQINSILNNQSFIPVIEHRIICKNGTVRWISNSCVLHYDTQMNLISYDGLICDITERKIAEQALKESGEILNHNFEKSPVAQAIVGPDFKFTKVNEAMCKLFGYTREEFKELSYIEITHPDDLEASTEMVNELNKGTDNSFEITKRYLTKEGNVLWCVLSIGVVKDSRGNVLYYLPILQDITDRVIAEEQIKSSLKEKETLLKEIHHRVKNNLQIITSLLTLQSENFKEKYIIEQFNECIDRIKIMALIHDNLYRSENFSRINFEKYVVQLANNLMHTYDADKRNICLKISVTDIYLSLDVAIPCGLIINEVITNSLKHAFVNKKSGTIKVSVHNRDKWYYVILIKDNGIGMDDSCLVDSKTLGLQLVKGLTEQIEGKLNYRKNKGSEFEIIFKKNLSYSEGKNENINC